MKVGVFEYIFGGGYQGNLIDHNVLCEGFSMLKDVTEDFLEAGYEVTTLLDSRLKNFQNYMEFDIFDEVTSKDTFENIFVNMLKSVDMSLIIAPETGGILSNLVKLAKSNSVSLNSSPESIDLATDKARVFEILQRNKVPTPETICLSNREDLSEISRLLNIFPGNTMIKPLDGAGCDGVFLEKNKTQLRKIIDSFVMESLEKRFIIQKYVEGIPISVNFILNGVKAVPISVNLQRVLLNSYPEPSWYMGGITPLNNPDTYKAINLAKKSLKHFKGLRGFVGVDIVISPVGPVVIEINPRLTVSYIGSKRVTSTNLADIMVKASIGESFQEPIMIENVSSYSKVSDEMYEEIKNDVEVICPKIQIDGKDTSHRFVVFNRKDELQQEKLFFKKYYSK